MPQINDAAGMFDLLEHKDSRSRAFWTSVGVHGVMLGCLLAIPLVLTDSLNLAKYYDTVLLAPPPQKKEILEVTPWRKPPEPVKPLPEKRMIAPPLRAPVVRELPKPKLEPKPEMLPKPIVPKPAVEPKPLEALNIPAPVLPAPPKPKPEVRTDVFAGNAAAPTTAAPARDVQTGGFGHPQGVPGAGRPGKAPNVPSLGSFDLPAGPGAGNGAGGARGTRGVVASSGFGNSGAATAPKGGNRNETVQQGGFGEANTAPAAPKPSQRPASTPDTPAEILFKPRPDYTEEARKAKIEGEVLLRILFTAQGEVRVLETTKSLGYGLDDNAIRAARQIRFKPAMRDGQPVDSTAIVHIVFQLAY